MSNQSSNRRIRVPIIGLIIAMLLSLLPMLFSATPSSAATQYVSIPTYSSQYAYSGSPNMVRIFQAKDSIVYGISANTSNFYQGIWNSGFATQAVALTSGATPYSMDFEPGDTYGYVTNQALDSITKINVGGVTTTGASTPVGDQPRGIVIGTTPTSAGAPLAFIANYGSNTVSVVDAATGTVESSISGFNGPESVAMSPDGSKVYVGNRGDASATATTSIAVIDTADFSVTTEPFPTLTNPSGYTSTPSPTWLEVSADGSMLFFVNQITQTPQDTFGEQTEIFALSTTDFTQVATLKGSGTSGTTFSSQMTQISLNADGTRLAAGEHHVGLPLPNLFAIWSVPSINTNAYPIPPATAKSSLGRTRGVAWLDPEDETLAIIENNMAVYGPTTTAPTITSVSPSSGELAGGEILTILGTGLTSASVTIGNLACTSVTVITGGITCVVPAAETLGPRNVTVSTGNGTAIATDAFTYGDPAPTVSAITPNKGPIAGGNTVTITGTDLLGSTVTIGGEDCTAVDINEAGTSLTCTVPEGADPGAVDVVVTNPTGPTTVSGGYTYVAPPTVNQITPDNGPLAGGNQIAITGTNLEFATAVEIDGNACSDLDWDADTNTLTCTVPEGTDVGSVSVSVTAPGGSVEAPAAYTYNAAPSITDISPSAGPLGGTNTITITGGPFDETSTVSIGGQECGTVAVAEGGLSLTCVVPPGA
ncbi:MAG: IPT/TIG domain-containing protein, partial [Candidatus Nanopelagicales bacterium]